MKRSPLLVSRGMVFGGTRLKKKTSISVARVEEFAVADGRYLEKAIVEIAIYHTNTPVA